MKKESRITSDGKKKKSRINNIMLVMQETVDELHLTEDLDTSYLISHTGFLHLFDNVEDPRREGQIVYRLSDILLMMLLYTLQQKRQSMTHLHDWLEAKKGQLEQVGVIRNGQIPSHDTFRRICLILDPAHIRGTVVQRFKEYLDQMNEASRDPEHRTYTLLNIDGQSFNGSGRGEDTKSPCGNISTLNVYDAGMYLNLEGIPIPEKTNEIPVAQEYLQKMNLKGCIVTADALHCQRDTCRIIREKKGHYALNVKDNQPDLCREIRARIENTERTHSLKRGSRTFVLYHLPSSYARDGFTGMQTFVKMISAGKKGTCTRYFITSLKDEETICEAIEERWSVENDLHRTKDMMLDQDRFRISDRNACGVVGALNDIAIVIIKLYQVLTGKETLAKAKAWFEADPIDATRELVAIQSSEEITEKIVAALESRHRKKRT